MKKILWISEKGLFVFTDNHPFDAEMRMFMREWLRKVHNQFEEIQYESPLDAFDETREYIENIQRISFRMGSDTKHDDHYWMCFDTTGIDKEAVKEMLLREEYK